MVLETDEVMTISKSPSQRAFKLFLDMAVSYLAWIDLDWESIGLPPIWDAVGILDCSLRCFGILVF